MRRARRAGCAGGGCAVLNGSSAERPRAIVMGLDPHRAQITVEWIDAARRQAGCRALMTHYGIGALVSIVILAELGDARRFSSSREAVRYAGLDITVHQSDQRRAPGHLSRQGLPALRWALFEAAQQARRTTGPVRAGRRATRRHRACLAIARKLIKRSYHTLRELGEGAPHTRMNPDRRAPRLSVTDAPRPAPRIPLPPRPRGRP